MKNKGFCIIGIILVILIIGSFLFVYIEKNSKSDINNLNDINKSQNLSSSNFVNQSGAENNTGFQICESGLSWKCPKNGEWSSGEDLGMNFIPCGCAPTCNTGEILIARDTGLKWPDETNKVSFSCSAGAPA